jgi:FtsH-binding integral membrane protein
MIETGIWLVVLLAGVALLGAVEAVRSGKFSGPRWETARFAVVAATLVILTLISGFLAVTWVIVILIWEIWEALLVALGVLGALGALALLVARYVRRRSV